MCKTCGIGTRDEKSPNKESVDVREEWKKKKTTKKELTVKKMRKWEPPFSLGWKSSLLLVNEK